MEIRHDMNLSDLAERMGSEATAAEAKAMRRILVEDYMDGFDTDEIPDSDWLELCDRAVELASA